LVTVAYQIATTVSMPGRGVHTAELPIESKLVNIDITVQRLPAPRRGQAGKVVCRDLVQGSVFGGAGIAGIVGPLPVGNTVLGVGSDAGAKNGGSQKQPYRTACSCCSQGMVSRCRKSRGPSLA